MERGKPVNFSSEMDAINRVPKSPSRLSNASWLIIRMQLMEKLQDMFQVFLGR